MCISASGQGLRQAGSSTAELNQARVVSCVCLQGAAGSLDSMASPLGYCAWAKGVPRKPAYLCHSSNRRSSSLPATMEVTGSNKRTQVPVSTVLLAPVPVATDELTWSPSAQG